MAQNENTLGAPTQGLGQNVTFAFDTSRGTPTFQPVQENLLNSGIVGGASGGTHTRATGVQAPPNPTLELLSKVGDAILRPMLEKKKTEAFFNGMQKAMSGEAVGDIVEQQPWYTKIFGDGDLVEGARAYSSHANVTSAISKIEDDMPNLRKMDSVQQQQYFNEQVNNSMTGDRATDAAILQSYTRVLGPAMKRASKEHFIWRQEQATLAQSEAINSSATALQKQGANLAADVLTSEDFDEQARQLTYVGLPAPGQDEKAWQTARTTDFLGMAKRGEFHALRAFEKQGYFERLSEAQQTAVQGGILLGQNRVRNDYRTTTAEEIAAIHTQAAVSEEGDSARPLAERIDAYNLLASKVTGVPDTISGQEKAALLSRKQVIIAHALAEDGRAVASLTAKGAKEAEVKLAVDRAMEGAEAGGTWRLLVGTSPELSLEKQQEWALPRYARLPTPEAKAQYLLKAFEKQGFYFPKIADTRKAEVDRAIAAGDKNYDAGAFEPVYQSWRMLHETNPAAAEVYYGDNNRRLERYHSALISNPLDKVGAFQGAFLAPNTRGAVDKDVMKEVVSTVKGGNWLLRALAPRTPIGDDSVNRVTAFLGPRVEAAVNSFPGTAADATKSQLEAAKAKNEIEVIGGHAWINYGRFNMRVEDYLSSAAGAAARAGKLPLATGATTDDIMQEAIEQKLNDVIPSNRLLGNGAEHIIVSRLRDTAGKVPQLHIMYQDKNGDNGEVLLLGSELLDLYAKRQAEKKQAASRISTGMPSRSPRTPNRQ